MGKDTSDIGYNNLYIPHIIETIREYQKKRKEIEENIQRVSREPVKDELEKEFKIIDELTKLEDDLKESSADIEEKMKEALSALEKDYSKMDIALVSKAAESLLDGEEKNSILNAINEPPLHKERETAASVDYAVESLPKTLAELGEGLGSSESVAPKKVENNAQQQQEPPKPVVSQQNAKAQEQPEQTKRNRGKPQTPEKRKEKRAHAKEQREFISKAKNAKKK